MSSNSKESRSQLRKKRKYNQLVSSNYVFNLPNRDSSDSELSSLENQLVPRQHSEVPIPVPVEEASEFSDFSDIDDIDEQPNLVIPSKKEYSEALLSSILSYPGVTLSSAEKIVNLFNIYLNRFSVKENLIPNIRYYWDKQARNNPVNVYVVCEENHPHGPFNGEPKNYGTFNCSGITHQVSLKPEKYFLHIPLRSQLETHLSILPESCWVDSDSTGRDIFNGAEAVRVKNSYQDNGIKRFTLTLHSDEVAVGNSSNVSIFPIFLTINEMSKKFRRENFFLVGLFVGRKKPSVNTFLTPIVDELKSLANEPLVWKDWKSNPIKSTFHLVAVIADAPMRAYLRNVRQYNHLNGCDWCLITARSEGRARVYDSLENQEIESLKRKKVDFLNFKSFQENRNQDLDEDRFFGLIGSSPLLELDDFDIVNGFAVEPMHCIVLGILRSIIFKSWLKPSGNLLESGIDLTLFRDEIGKRIKVIRVSSECPRPPRDFNQIKYWKSSEFDSFLCYYFIPCARGLLKSKVISNLNCLVKIYYLMNCDSVTNDITVELKNLIKEFRVGVERIYGNNQLTYNLHILSHLPDSVNSLGPFANINAYPLENQMGILKEKVRRTSNIAQNLVRVFLNDFKHRELIESKVNFWLLSSRENQIFETRSGGDKIHITSIPDLEIREEQSDLHEIYDELVYQFGIYIVGRFDSIKFFQSVCYNNRRFSTKAYGFDKKRDDSIVRLKNSSFAQIKKILEINGNFFLVVNSFESSPYKQKFKGFTGDFLLDFQHIHELKNIREEIQLVRINEVKSKGILIHSQNYHFKYTKNFLIEQFLENK